MFATPHLNLNDALGGGLPETGMVELYGFEQSGKTSLALSMTAQHSNSFFMDLDGSFPYWAHQIQSRMFFSNYHLLFETDVLRDQLIEIITCICESINPPIIILDPIAVLGYKGIGTVLSAISPLSAARLFILINHAYQNDESVSSSSTSFHCCQRIRFGKGLPIKENGLPIGIRSRLTITKNIYAFIPQYCDIEIMFT